MEGAEQDRAIIAGGGLAGLATAIALRQAGIDARIFERATDLRQSQVGSGLHLWPNAMRRLQQVGLAERLEAAGAKMRELEYASWRRGRLTGLKLDEIERKMRAPTIAVTRRDLHEALTSGLDADVVCMDAACTGFEHDAAGVTVRLGDGREVRGGFLIGADGIKSTIRAQLLRDGQPRYVGYTIWRAVTPFQNELTRSGTIRLTWGPGCRFVFFDVGGGRLYWAAVANEPEGGLDPPNGRKAGLLERFAGWPAPTEEIIASTDEAAIVRGDNYDRDPASRWGEGRVVLIGDAAHPMLFNIGQGAAQSIEDGFVLTQCLREHGDVAEALRAFAQRRMKRTAQLMRMSRQVGALGRWERPWAVRVREQIHKRVLNERALLRTVEPEVRLMDAVEVPATS